MMTDVLNLDYLRPLFEGEPQALAELVQEAAATSARLTAAIAQSCAEKSEGIVDEAHELKGVARTTGASEVADLVEAIESLGREERWPEIEPLVEPLRQAHLRFAAAAEALP